MDAHGRTSSTVRTEMTRFLLVGGVTLVLVAALGVLVAQAISRDVAIREAEARGQTFARAVCAPLVDADLLAGDPRAAVVFDRVMTNRLRDGSVVHIKVWLPDGTVLWADQTELAGRRFPLDQEVVDLFGSSGVVGTLSPPDDPEDAELPPTAEDLLEVYASATAVDGQPVVVETYWSTSGLDATSAVVRGRLLPLTLGALLLFAVPAALLSLSLARRVDRTRRAHATLLRQALDASDHERRRIAADLHDGVLQDVSAARYVLGALDAVVTDDPALARLLLGEASSALERVGADLRSTLVDIYPADLAHGGLAEALRELLRPLAADGVETTLEVDVDPEEPLELVQLAYRLAREAISNVHRHARARHVLVSVTTLPAMVRVEVVDDGRGLPTGPLPEDHFGLRLLDDTTRSLGGSLDLGPGPGGGTRLAAELPRALAPREEVRA